MAHGFGGIVMMEVLQQSSAYRRLQTYLGDFFSSTEGIVSFGPHIQGPSDELFFTAQVLLESGSISH